MFVADGCHLCEAALEIVEDVAAELGLDVELVDIGGDAELERRHREWIPVVEIDGERAFTLFVQRDALRERLTAAS